MDLTIASLLDVVDRLGWMGGRTDLLTYPEYVLFKGIDTIIDEKRIRLGLKLNVYTLPFNPKALIQKSLTNDQEDNNEEKQDTKQNTSNINNGNILNQTQDKWVEVLGKKSRYTAIKEEEEIQKGKQRQNKRSLLKKKTNRYQELKEIEVEEENKMEEESRMEIKKEVCDLENEKAIPITYEINKMSLEEVEKICKQDEDYNSSKDNAKNREEEAGFSNDEAAVYQNDLLLYRLEQAEKNEEILRKDIHDLLEEKQVLVDKLKSQSKEEKGEYVDKDTEVEELRMQLKISTNKLERSVKVNGQLHNEVDELKKSHEERMAVVEMAVEDYGLQMKWTEEGLYVSELLDAEDDVSIEDDDTSWDEKED